MESEIYKKYSSNRLESLFNEYNMIRIWKQYLPKELINKLISNIEINDKIDLIQFEIQYCGNNILNGPFFSSIKDLFFLYNKNIFLTGIYIDKSNWYIFFKIDDKFKYFKLNYEIFDFEKNKQDYINLLIKKHKFELKNISKFISYLKQSPKEIVFFPKNTEYVEISNTFTKCLELQNKNKTRKKPLALNYNHIIIKYMFGLDIQASNENDIYFIILWNTKIYKFKEKLIFLLKYLTSFSEKIQIKSVIQINEIDFIFETNKYICGISFYEFKTRNKIFIEENIRNKNAIKLISNKIFFPFENNFQENYFFSYQALNNYLNRIKGYKKTITSYIKNKNKNLQIKFITFFNDNNFKLKEEVIVKINSIIENYNINNPNNKLDEFIYLSNLK